jgi:hypothetical protein
MTTVYIHYMHYTLYVRASQICERQPYKAQWFLCVHEDLTLKRLHFAHGVLICSV